MLFCTLKILQMKRINDAVLLAVKSHISPCFIKTTLDCEKKVLSFGRNVISVNSELLLSLNDVRLLCQALL